MGQLKVAMQQLAGDERQLGQMGGGLIMRENPRPFPPACPRLVYLLLTIAKFAAAAWERVWVAGISQGCFS